MVLHLILLFLVPYIQAAVLPSPCCSGHQFSTTLHQVTGSYNFGTKLPQTFEATTKLTYDYDAKMTKSETAGVTIVNNYNTRKSYEISGHSCKVNPLTDVIQPPCIPATATYRGRYYIGDDVNYEVNIWHIVDNTLGNITVSVMPENCVPIMQGIGKADSKMISQTTMYFHDVVFGAPASDAFTVPHSCHGK